MADSVMTIKHKWRRCLFEAWERIPVPERREFSAFRNVLVSLEKLGREHTEKRPAASCSTVSMKTCMEMYTYKKLCPANKYG